MEKQRWNILQAPKMDNILITSAGRRVSLVRDFQKEIRKLDNNNKVYTVDLDPALASACQVSDGYKHVKPVTDPGYIPQLLEICKTWHIKIIIPTIDTELLALAKNKGLFLKGGIIPIISNEDFVKTCRDKRLINQFFQKHHIDTPQKIDKNDPGFPLFIKPYDGSRSQDTFLIEKESELRDYHFQNDKLMFMEYISHKNHDEYTVDAYYNKKGNLKCAVPRKRIVVRDGEVSKGVTHKNEIVDCVKDKLSYIEGAVGCLTMQFFFNRKTKRIIGIEINPRFGGGYPLSYLAGANYPKWLIQEYICNEKINDWDEWEENLLMLRYDDEVLVSGFED